MSFVDDILKSEQQAEAIRARAQKESADIIQKAQQQRKDALSEVRAEFTKTAKEKLRTHKERLRSEIDSIEKEEAATIKDLEGKAQKNMKQAISVAKSRIFGA